MDQHAEWTPRSFAFGPFLLVPERQLLMEDEVRLRIGGRALDILTALVERPGELVSKRELLARVWPNTTVEEGNLKVNVAALRRALGEGSHSSKYIGTVVGQGYRFTAPVTSSGSALPWARGCAAPSQRHNLPPAAMRILGRATTIEAIRKDLAEARLVSVVGAGGVGKTTVALAVAQHEVATVRDGVWMVDLSRLDDPSLVPNAIAAALGLTTHSPNILAALCAFLKGREVLLLLDSCEPVIDAAAHCADRLLADAPGIRILATSREPLRVTGERVRRLRGLEAPPPSPHISAEEALAFPAVQLFVGHAAGRIPSFRLSDADAPLVAEICQKLDGLALAIEIAATRADSFSIRELRDLLGDWFRILEGNRSGPKRHETLTATVDWSYELLKEGERAVMRRLSILVGSFDLETACAIAADEGIPRAEAIAGLANLVAKSLVSAEKHAVGQRYRMLDTTRSYALYELARNGEAEIVQRRHAEHFLEVATRAGAERDALAPADWRERHGGGIDDIRSALRWAFGGVAHVAIGVRLTLAAIPFWEELSLVEECRVSLERALEDRFAAQRSDGDELALRMTLGKLLFHMRGPQPGGKALWVRALALAERIGDVDRQIACLVWLSNHQIWAAEFRAVLATGERIRELARAAGPEASAANTDMQEGHALLYLGRPEEGRQRLERGIGRREPPGRHRTGHFELDQRLTAMSGLVKILWAEGCADQAAELSRRQSEQAEASGNAVPICAALLHTACPLALDVGDFDLAGELLEAVEEIVATHELKVWAGMAMCTRGIWRLRLGDASGVELLRQALPALRDSGIGIRYPNYLAAYAEGLARKGRLDEARRALDQAITLCDESEQVWTMPELLHAEGQLLHAAGGPQAIQAASVKYLEAIACAQRHGALSWELRAAISLVDLGLSGDGNSEAEEVLSSIYGRFREGFWTRDMRRARILLGRAGATTLYPD